MTGNTGLQNTASRVFRITSFALLSLLIIYSLVQYILAWILIESLTHPFCFQNIESTNLFQHQEVMLHTSDGLILRAWYYPPNNNTTIIALGGLNGALGSNLPPVEFLLQDGYGILQIDSRACADPPTAVTLGAREINDVKAALDFLEEQPEVKVIAAYGFSMGGVTAIRAAARYPKIAAIVAEGGYFNLGYHFIEAGQTRNFLIRFYLYSLSTSFWQQHKINPWKISPIDDLQRISPRPILLIYGEHEANSGKALEQYASAKNPRQLWIVPNGDHGINHLINPDEYSLRVRSFFSEALLWENKKFTSDN
jgi:uncharacterized protein